MVKYLFVLFFLCLAMPPASMAGKLYKIVDAQGNVTFSQFPPAPAKASESLKVEETEVKTGSEVRVDKKGVASFCGDLKLPDPLRYKNNFYSTVSRKLDYWEKDLSRKEESLRKSETRYLKNAQQRAKYNSRYNSSYNSSSYDLKRNQGNLKSIKDLRCAIKWAKSRSVESSLAAEKMTDELVRLDKNLVAVKSQLMMHCGEEPIYSPSIKGNKNAIRTWNRCARSYQSSIRKLESLIQTESRKLEQF